MRLALFDIDGVIANDTHRVHHALAQAWPLYFDPKTMAGDTVWEQGREAIAAEQAAGSVIAYLTGRREDLRPVTSTWLEENGFPNGVLFMRPKAVTIPLANLKTQVLRSLIDSGQYESVVLYDDDPEVVRLARTHFGEDVAVHCTWHVKQQALIRKATS